MRLIPHPPEKRAEAKRLGESTTMSCAEIAAQLDVSASTVRSWKRIDGWKRPPGAPTRRTFTTEDRHAIGRLRRLGARNADIARLAGCHSDTVPRAARRRGAAAEAPAAAPFAGFAPEAVARLHEALSAGGAGKPELLRLAERACAFVLADLLGDRTLPPDRRARGMTFAIANIKALPDDAPAAGAPSHDHQPGPATFEEYNALLEELARGFAGLGPAGETAGTLGAPAGPEAAAPQ